MTRPSLDDIPATIATASAAAGSLREAARIADIDHATLIGWQTGKHRPNPRNWAGVVQAWRKAGLLKK